MQRLIRCRHRPRTALLSRWYLSSNRQYKRFIAVSSYRCINRNVYPSGGETVIRKCANPSCETEFRYSTKGRLFPFEIKGPVEPCRDVPAVICDNKPERATVYFWLCSRCCRRFTLEFSRADGLLLIQLDAEVLCASANTSREARTTTMPLSMD